MNYGNSVTFDSFEYQIDQNLRENFENFNNHHTCIDTYIHTYVCK